jgi:photosystem II stability/assembly factor-like uncharacterized protein
MSRERIRIAAIAICVIATPLIASCQATATVPVASSSPSSQTFAQPPPGGTTAVANTTPCQVGARNELIEPTSVKMVSPTEGWALAQCTVSARPFAASSSVQCEWPQIEDMGVLRTSDAGRTWTDVSPPSVPNRTWHHAQFFLDANHAWTVEVSRGASDCVSQITTYGTADGGKTWSRGATVPIQHQQPTDDVYNICCWLNYMDFIDPQRGWLVVASPANPPGPGAVMTNPTALYSTTDGGQHWSLVARQPGAAALSGAADCNSGGYSFFSDVHFTSATSGSWMLLCPGQVMLRTQDGGVHWTAIPLPACTCQAFQPTYFDSAHAVITGQQSNGMMSTADGGATWSQHAVPKAATSQYSFTDPMHGWIVSIQQLPTSYDTAVFRTADGGQSWSMVSKPGFATSLPDKNAYYNLAGVQFVNSNVGFVTLGQAATPNAPPGALSGEPVFQLWETTDGGVSWTSILRQLPSSACTSSYQQLQNGGGNGDWPQPEKLAGATTAWAKGGLRTTDAGLHWKDVSPTALREGKTTPLYPAGFADFYLDANHAWEGGVYDSATGCGDHVTVFGTGDGGKTWQASSPITIGVPAGDSLGAVTLGFTDAQSGWLWIPVGKQSFDFGGQTTDAYVFVTSDGGVSWRRVSHVTSALLGSANGQCTPRIGQFTSSSPTVAWVTGGCGDLQILVTRDGGATWKLQTLGSAPAGCQCPTQLPTFVDQNHGFIQNYGTGPEPTLLATSDGGVTWKTLPPLPSSGFTMALTFADANTLFDLVTPPGWTKISGGKDSLYRSTDGGQTWTVVQDGVPMGRVNVLLFADGQHGLVTEPKNSTWAYDAPDFANSWQLQAAVTSDGGHTWKIFTPQT